MIKTRTLVLMAGIVAMLSATACKNTHEEVISTYENGNVQKVYIVTDGKDDSKVRIGEKVFYEDGTLMSEKHFDNEQPSGEWSFYHPNGQLHARGTFSKDNPMGSQWVFYTPDGEPYYNKEADSLIVLELTADQRPLSIAYCVKNTRYIFQFNDNFTINARGKTVDNLRDGRWEFFYADGSKLLDATYNHGLEEGAYTSFRPNGIPYFRGFYINGKRASIWEVYDEAGNLVGTKDYDAK